MLLFTSLKTIQILVIVCDSRTFQWTRADDASATVQSNRGRTILLELISQKSLKLHLKAAQGMVNMHSVPEFPPTCVVANTPCHKQGERHRCFRMIKATTTRRALISITLTPKALARHRSY
jgi:hypothetical protein